MKSNMTKDFDRKAKLCLRDGGPVIGPGTGTSDDVPLKGSNGEYMLPADTVAAVGIGTLDALKNATHTPVDQTMSGHYANGGLIEDPLRQVETTAPSLRQVTPGITQTTPGVFNAEPLQNPGRTMPRPAAVPAEPMVNTAAPQPSLRDAIAGNPAQTGLRDALAGRMPAPDPSPMTRAPAPLTPEAMGRQAGAAVRNALPSIGATPAPNLGGAVAGLASFGPDLEALGNNSALTFGQQAKLFGRDATRAIGGLVGGTVGAGVGTGLAGPIVGTAVGGGLGGIGGMQAADALTGGLRRGANFINEKLGGSKDYFSSVDQDMRAAGYNPNRTLTDAVMQRPEREGVRLTPDARARIAGGALDGAPAAQAAPAQPFDAPIMPQPANMASFKQQYGGAAQRAAEQLGVDPNLLLSQWGMETGWGKSIIPGTNNLGNIKDFSGGGVGATDNATGSRDKYRKFDTPEDFADHYVGLMQRKYPGVQGAGNDVNKFTAGLNGYAEDKQYGRKIASIYNTLGNPSVQQYYNQDQGLRQGAPSGASSNPVDQVEVIRGTQRSMGNAGVGQFRGIQRPDMGISLDRMISMANINSDAQHPANIPAVMQAYAAQEAARNQNDTTREGNQLTAEVGRGQIAANLENARGLREMTAAEHQRQALQFGVTSRREQAAQERLNAADDQNRRQTADNELQKFIEQNNTVAGKDGKAEVDGAAVGRQRQTFEQIMANLGVKSAADLDKHDKAQIMAAAHLYDKVEKDADNWNPLTPGHLGQGGPMSLLGMTRLPNGDAQTYRTVNGQRVPGAVIPERYFRKEGADRIGGVPTNRYDVLFRGK